jgi:hypothetical protein
MVQLGARSVSRQVREWLGEGPAVGRVLAVHRRACNLVTEQGDVIALVAPEIGDGPLNIVLGHWPDFLGDVQAGKRVTYGPTRLVFNGLGIDLEAADTWEPCPDWEALRVRRSAAESSLASLAALCLEHDPANALLPLLGSSSPLQGLAAILTKQFCEAAGQLEAGWGGDQGALAEGGAALAGLGDGLTPAGDDFLVGVMLWAWLAHPAPEQFCSTLAEAAAPRTMILSAAFLWAAARGQCSAAWHKLLAALAEGRSAEIAGAARGVLAHGASSGLDALIGFLYLSQDKEDACQTSM